MVIGSRQRLRICNNESIHIEYDGKVIERCFTLKCLGVIIDENILWHDHVKSVCKKVVAVLRRVRPFVDDNILNLLYMCLVQSQMDYCEIWGNRFNSHIELITRLQKRAAICILLLKKCFRN